MSEVYMLAVKKDNLVKYCYFDFEEQHKIARIKGSWKRE